MRVRLRQDGRLQRCDWDCVSPKATIVRVGLPEARLAYLSLGFDIPSSDDEGVLPSKLLLSVAAA